MRMINLASALKPLYVFSDPTRDLREMRFPIPTITIDYPTDLSRMGTRGVRPVGCSLLCPAGSPSNQHSSRAPSVTPGFGFSRYAGWTASTIA